MKKEIICINCPMGCRLTVTLENDKVTEVTGASCNRGKEYAEEECTNPTRMVTSTVMLSGGQMKTLSVKTERAVPKKVIMDCVRSLKGIKVKAPVKIGDIIVKNVCGTGINIIATKNAR